MAKFSWRYDPKTQEFKKAFVLGGNLIVEAANAAVKDSAAAGVLAGRANIAGAGFSNRWQKSLRYKMITPAKSLKPVAYIHTTINYADVFEKGADIEGKRGLLWLPLSSVPGRGRRKHMSPSQYVKSIGPLVTLIRPGKPPILAAAIRRGAKAQPFGKFATRGQLKRGVTSKGQVEMIPLFVGIESVHIGKKWDVTGALQRATANMPQYYEDEIKKLDTNKLLQG